MGVQEPEYLYLDVCVESVFWISKHSILCDPVVGLTGLSHLLKDKENRWVVLEILTEIWGGIESLVQAL